MNTFLNAAVAEYISAHICDPAGYGKRVARTRDDRFTHPSPAAQPFDGTFENLWPWLAANVLHTEASFERKDRLRVDVWTASKTGENAGVPDLVLPVATFYGNGEALLARPRVGNIQPYLDLTECAERITAHCRLHGLVPANRILRVWRWASELAEQGEVRGREVTWTVNKYHFVEHSVDGQPVTSVSVDDLNTYWGEISALHDACP